MNSIEELIERVRSATGPDRAVDRDIFLLNLDPSTDAKPVGGFRYQIHKVYVDGEETWTVHEPPRYTSSVDAILALIERELSDVAMVIHGPMSNGWGVEIHRFINPNWMASGQAPTLPLALCAAFLSALTARPK